MHRGGSQRALDPALARRADEGVDRERGLLGLQPHEQLGDIGGQTARPAAVDTGLRIQRLEAAAAVQRQPVADGLGGDAGAARAGDSKRAFSASNSVRSDALFTVAIYRSASTAIIAPSTARRSASGSAA